MRLDSLHPGATVEAVRDTIGWEVAVAPDLAATPAPTDATSCGSSARSSIRAASTRSRRPGRAGPAGRTRPVSPCVKLTRNSSVPVSAIETMKPPMFGAVIE